MNKFIIIIQALLNKLSAAYKEIFALKDLCESYESHIDFLEKMEKLDKKQIANLERLNRASEYSNKYYIKSIRNDIEEINSLKRENEQLKQKIINTKNFESIIHNLAIILLEETEDKNDIVHMLDEAGVSPNDLSRYELNWMVEKYGF